MGFKGQKFPEDFDPILQVLDDDVLLIYSTASGKPMVIKLSELPFGIDEQAVLDLVAQHYINLNQKGAANGVATLDSGAKIPLTQIPDTLLGQVNYISTWNASTNTPTLPTTPAKKGDYYVVNTAGTRFGYSFAVGDWCISNGTAWEKVDNTDAVMTVFGRLGNVVAVNTDYAAFYLRHDTAAQGLNSTQKGNARGNIDVYAKADVYNQSETNALLAQKVSNKGDVISGLLEIFRTIGAGETIPLLLRNNATNNGTATVLKLLNSTNNSTVEGAAEIVCERTNIPQYASIIKIRNNRGSGSVLQDALKIDENGNLISYGNILATGRVGARQTSSKYLKHKVKPIKNAFAILEKLRPINFSWNKKAKKLCTEYDDKLNFGFIAEELEEVLPSLIYPIHKQYKSIDQIQITPILVSAFKELKAEFDELKSTANDLKCEIEKLKKQNGTSPGS